MLTKTYSFPALHNSGCAAHTDYLFLDIETTGFSRDTTILYLIGCGLYENGQFSIIQWFNNDGVSEKNMLQALIEFLHGRKNILFTFNGESFDLPYLNRHFELNELSFSLDRYPSLDIYKILKPFQTFFSLPHGKQKDWEQFLGIHREDKYNGGQLITLYKAYLRTKEESLLNTLLLHNMEDIRGMESLLPLTAYKDLLDGRLFFQESSIARLPDSSKRHSLTVSCTLGKALPKSLDIPVIRLNNPELSGALHCAGENLSLTLPFIDDSLKYFYSDYKNYFYLPEEDRAVHKSIGCYVDSRFRKKASAATCYVRKPGCFLPVPPAIKYKGIQTNIEKYKDILTLYKTDYRDKDFYAEFEQLFHKNFPLLPLYISDWIKTFMITDIKMR